MLTSSRTEGIYGAKKPFAPVKRMWKVPILVSVIVDTIFLDRKMELQDKLYYTSICINKVILRFHI